MIKAETGAIEHYTRIVEETEGVDPVTQDMVIGILRDEQGHRRLFEGFLREYEIEGIAEGSSTPSTAWQGRPAPRGPGRNGQEVRRRRRRRA